MLHTNQGVWRTRGCGRCVIDNGSWALSWARHMSNRPEGWCVCSRSSCSSQPPRVQEQGGSDPALPGG